MAGAPAKNQTEKRTQWALAFEIARGYCERNGLSVDKLRRQRFELIYDQAIFAQPGEAKPNGLINDLETQPKATLIIQCSEDRISVQETEYTRKYLAN